MKKLFILSCMALFGQSAMAQSLNGTMETWHSYNSGMLPPVALEAPQGWYGLDSVLAAFGPLISPTTTFKQHIFKSTDKHGGTYAAKLMTRDLDTAVGIIPGVMSNAKFVVDLQTQNLTMSGGTPVTQRIASVSTWIKHIPMANDDSGEVDVMAILTGQGAGGTDSIVGENSVFFGGMSAYTLVNVPVIYNNATVVPDKIQVVYTSSDGTDATDSTSMYVDDAVMNTATGVQLPVFNQDVMSCYPNPSTGMLYLTNKTGSALTWEAFNAAGQVIAARTFSDNSTVSLASNPAGIYFYRVSDREGRLLQTGKFSLRP